jgi:hypothetical protein
MEHDEEQRHELEALDAIFASDFHLTSADPPRAFELVVVPNAGGEDNHVSLRMFVTYPPTYPSVPAAINLRNEKGLIARQIEELKAILEERAAAALGEVSIYTIAEGLKEYLLDNNKAELSMYDQMAQRVAAKDTEEEERLAKRKALEERIEARRSEPSPLGIEPGTLLTPESFQHWRELFDAEQKAIREARDALKPQQTKLTGKQLFQQNLAKELDESEAETLPEESAPPAAAAADEAPLFFDRSLYAEEDDGEGSGSDSDGDDEVAGMFDTDMPTAIAPSSRGASSSSSSSAAPAPAAAPAAASARKPPGFASSSSSSSKPAASTPASAASSSSSSSFAPPPVVDAYGKPAGKKDDKDKSKSKAPEPPKEMSKEDKAKQQAARDKKEAQMKKAAMEKARAAGNQKAGRK